MWSGGGNGQSPLQEMPIPPPVPGCLLILVLLVMVALGVAELVGRAFLALVDHHVGRLLLLAVVLWSWRTRLRWRRWWVGLLRAVIVGGVLGALALALVLAFALLALAFGLPDFEQPTLGVQGAFGQDRLSGVGALLQRPRRVFGECVFQTVLLPRPW